MAAVGRAVPDLGRVASSTSEQPDVRTAAVRALGEGGQPSALQLVASAARVADDPAFAVAIDGSLARLAIHSEDPISLLRDVLERARPAANIDAQAEALRSLGALKAERDLVREHLVDPDGYVRGAAALALADMADRDAIATARSQASEGLERVQMAAAAAKLGEQGAADDLHALLVGRDAVDGPIWALRSSVKRAIVDAFDAAEGHPGSDRALAWNEVLHLEPDAIPPRTAAATPPSGPPISNAANGEQMSIGTQAAPPPADGRPVAPPPGPEPTPSGRRPPRGAAGAGLPSSQADPAASVDRLGRAPMVNVLTAMLDDDQQGTPFTFALFGSWGAGKSSVLRMLHDQLTKPSRRHELLVATFNAWSFEKTDNIAAGLAQETFDAIVPAGSVRRLAFRLRYGLRAHRARLLGVCAVLVTSLVSAGYGLVVGTRDDSIAKVLIGTGGLTVFSLIGTVAIRLYQHPIASEVLTSLRLPDYRAQVGPLQRMRDELEQAWALRRAQLAKRDRHGRLVIFVDDLDRCSPEAITATLDAIRLVVALDECIVIIALDERIGLRAIAAEYEALAGPDFDDEDVARVSGQDHPAARTARPTRRGRGVRARGAVPRIVPAEGWHDARGARCGQRPAARPPAGWSREWSTPAGRHCHGFPGRRRGGFAGRRHVGGLCRWRRASRRHLRLVDTVDVHGRAARGDARACRRGRRVRPPRLDRRVHQPATVAPAPQQLPLRQGVQPRARLAAADGRDHVAGAAPHASCRAALPAPRPTRHVDRWRPSRPADGPDRGSPGRVRDRRVVRPLPRGGAGHGVAAPRRPRVASGQRNPDNLCGHELDGPDAARQGAGAVVVVSAGTVVVVGIVVVVVVAGGSVVVAATLVVVAAAVVVGATVVVASVVGGSVAGTAVVVVVGAVVVVVVVGTGGVYRPMAIAVASSTTPLAGSPRCCWYAATAPRV